ncbi:small acid-soluble spore protein Tlp [Virgibacillus sp. 179-BFC.A HS]|uniref:Small, acid-soluble spore protein Tlp n=1 Tax=Tigheibacillus jepli TaxID=3035914 RepID=A0ABU5CHE9_9BACI|nr:small acid-soluble spore protein Tlp [Virgibacillus sp. 179-BFC.A HS]MDY0405782.1 small acid-soluble spore protein Tlp [Virgibacillus sp. 179-BFC.A HS]
MTNNNNQPKPDDRSDNIEKLQQMVEDTIANMEASEETLKYSEGEAREQIKAKNERRKDAIQGMKAEMKDEKQDQQM